MLQRLQLYRIIASLVVIIITSTVYELLYPVLAIGPGTGGSKIRVSDERIGPYILLVATAPLPVTVGQMSVWVRVTDGQTNQVRRDAIVTVEATPFDGGPTLTAQGSHQNAGNDYDYVAHLPVERTGQWNIAVLVEDEPGQAETTFTETVTRGLGIQVLVAIGLPFVVLAVVVAIYLWRRAAMA
ncbi:MAG: hypothetical protein KJ077_02335 [Anaerolineae bacterium]|nr:hypothetical protein [Anaerolineae bacterium]